MVPGLSTMMRPFQLLNICTKNKESFTHPRPPPLFGEEAIKQSGELKKKKKNGNTI